MEVNKIVTLVLKAVALAMGVAGIVLGFFDTPLETRVSLMSIGLAAVALAALQKE